MTMDGGLERLVRIIYDFCLCPPPPENPALMYGLTPPNSRPPKSTPTLNPSSWDKQAAYRFSLAFQCVVNIGVRGSEPIRSRVVQAGTLEVVGMILEAWLVSRGFAVGPSSSATGLPRETREQRAARKEAQIRAAREHQQVVMTKDLERRLAHEAQLREQEQRERHAQDSEDQQATVRTHHQSSSRPALRIQRSQVDDDAQMDTSTPSSSSIEPLILVDSDTASGSTSLSTSAYSSTLPTPSGLGPSGSDTEMSTDASAAATPIGSGTPTGSVTIPSRDRSGTVIGRPIWDPPPSSANERRRGAGSSHGRSYAHELTTARPGPGPSTMMMMGRISPDSPANLTDTSRPETETEDDDVDMDRNANRTITNGSSHTPTATRSSRRTITGPSSSRAHVHAQDSSPERSDGPPSVTHRPRRAVGIVSDEPSDSNNGPNNASDAHIIINDGNSVTAVDGLPGVDGAVGVVGSVEDGIVSLEPNDDFAMGAPPGAPGAIGEGPGGPNPLAVFNDPPGGIRRRGATVIGAGGQVDAQATVHPDITPRAGVIPLPSMGGTERAATTGRQQGRAAGGRRDERMQAERGNPPGAPHPTPMPPVPGAPSAQSQGHSQQTRASQCTDSSSNPYRDDDVLLGLQLLAYLSKYPHVRQTFYKPRQAFHPATVEIARQQQIAGVYGMQMLQQQQQQQQQGGRTRKDKERERANPREGHSAGTAAANLFKVFTGARDKAVAGGSGKETHPTNTSPIPPNLPPRQTNVFSLVERFTFKPSSAETEMLANPPPEVPTDIQYWAGVIMRNACRKDDQRGGVRQCANMLCGKWETFAREFAKCRRCRKAKYCGKECQSTAWSEGHRFWCSAKDEDGPIHGVDPQHQQQLLAQMQQQQQMREHHPREHHRGHATTNGTRVQAPNTTPTHTATDGTDQPAFIPPASSAQANAERAERRQAREQARQQMAERNGAPHMYQDRVARPPNPGPDTMRHGRREQVQERHPGLGSEEMRRQWEQQQQRRQRRAARAEDASASASPGSSNLHQQPQSQPQQDIWASATYSPAMSSRRRAETTSFVGSSTAQPQQEATPPHLNAPGQQSPWFLLRTRRDARPTGAPPTGQPVSVAATETAAAAAAEAAGDGSGSPMRLSSLDDDDMMVG